MTQKLTEWFLLSEQKPGMVGVYQCANARVAYWQESTAHGYCWWDGKEFHFGKNTPQSAKESYDSGQRKGFGSHVTHWRGLSTNPATTKPSGNRKVTRYVVMRKSDPPAPVATYSGWIHAVRKSNELTLSTPFRYYVVKIRHRTPEAT